MINSIIRKKTNTHKVGKKFKYQNKLSVLLIIVLSFASVITGCAKNNNDLIIETGFYFDTVISITVYNQSEKKYINDCFDLCEKYENMLSNNIKDSEVSLINKMAGIDYVTVSDDCIELINKGIYYSEISDGKFDITIGKLSQLWDFSSDNPMVPDKSMINKYLKNVNYKNIKVNGNNIMLTDTDSMIDLGGIAKGYIADKLKEYLISKNVKSAVINLGGNVLLIGDKNDSNYIIGLQLPFGGENDMIATFSSSDNSIVTSGIYQRYFYQDNVLYHHILNTSTGYPIENELNAVTIISLKSVDGDGLSTSVFAMGKEKGIEFVENLDGVEAIFIDKDNNITTTSGLIYIDKNIPEIRMK